MEFLNSVAQMLLLMLDNFVNDDCLGALLWVFILVMTVLIMKNLWEGVSKCIAG